MKKSNQEILQMIYDNSTYNEDKKEYQISKQLRDSLNLSKKRWKRINTICKINGITIEYPNKPLIEVKEVELFEKYNEIKSKIENETNLVELENLEKERIKIRNKIAIANLELIKEIINRRINGKDNPLEINNQLTKEDLYQYGYEVLLHYLDIHYLYKETIKKDLNNILINYIQNKIATDFGSSREYLNNLKKLKKYLNNLSTSTIDIKLLSKQLELPIETVINLLNLENIQNPLSLEQEINNLDLLDETLEEELFKKIQKEQLLKLINTLSTEIQKQVIILTYGLSGEEEYSNAQIAKKINKGLTNVNKIRNKTLKNLVEPVRLKYLLKIIEREEEIPFDIHKEISSPNNIALRRLEKFLLLNLGKEELLKLVDTLNSNDRTALFLYFNYTEIVDEEDLEKKSKNTIFYQENKERALKFLRNKIEELYIQNNSNENIQDYFDYLMHNYLNKQKKIYRTK